MSAIDFCFFGAVIKKGVPFQTFGDTCLNPVICFEFLKLGISPTFWIVSFIENKLCKFRMIEKLFGGEAH